mgnify:CR=1 FL=1
MRNGQQRGGHEETLENAQTIALRAFTHLLADDHLRDRFMSLSGSSPGDLPGMMQDPAFLGGVLHFVLADESLLLAFCAAHNLRPEDVQRAGNRLIPPIVD